MVDDLLRLSKFLVFAECAAGIWIAIVIWKVAAGNFDLNSVSLPEYVADRHEINGVLVDGSRSQQLLLFKRSAIAAPHNSIAQNPRIAIRSEVVEDGGEVGVATIRGGKQSYQDSSRHFYVLLQLRRGVDQNVVASLNGAAVARAVDIGG